jgi:hypothetical protein
VLESVLSVGRHAAPKDQFGGHELPEGLIDLLLRHLSNRADQLVRERATERCADLGDFPRRCQAIKPRHQ